MSNKFNTINDIVYNELISFGYKPFEISDNIFVYIKYDNQELDAIYFHYINNLYHIFQYFENIKVYNRENIKPENFGNELLLLLDYIRKQNE